MAIGDGPVEVRDIVGETPAQASEARRFPPAGARVTPGWIQRNGPVYEAALSLAVSTYGAVGR